MSEPRWRQLESLFAQLMEAAPGERRALLRHSTESDAGLQAEALDLLELYEEDSQFLEQVRPPETLAVGDSLGNYRVEGILGEGGMGVVYRARRGDGPCCAIKILRAPWLADGAMRKRFERECQALRSLSHPNIVRVEAVEQDEAGNHILIMELVEGVPLSSHLAAGGIGMAQVLDFASQIAAALAAAHRAGLVHRDLKPGNLMVTQDGVVKLLDFGLCLWRGPQASSVSRTHAGLLLGTAPYMSPEQAQGLEVGPSSDVFSFGVILYEMLAGKAPFAASNAIATLAAILHREPEPIAGIPREVAAVLSRCLSKQADARYRSGTELLQAVEELRDRARHGVLRAPGRSLSRSAVIAATCAAASVAAAFSLHSWSREGGQPDPLQSILTPDFYPATQPAVSTDGKMLAFAGSRDGEGPMQIWIRPLAGGPARQLTADAAGARDPAFSPDGASLVYRSDDAGGQVMVAPAGGGPSRRIGSAGRGPRFSPDGKWIAYWIGPDGSTELTRAGAAKVFVVAASGGEPRQIAVDMPSAYTPVWSPDGRGLLVMGRNLESKTTRPALWVARFDGGPSRMLHDMGGPTQEGGEPLQWSASGVVTMLGAAREGWPIVEMHVSPKSWTVQSKPRTISLLPRQSSRPAQTRDHLLHAATTLRTSVWTLRVDADGRPAAAPALAFSCPGDLCLPWLSGGGRKMAYSSYQDRWTVHTRLEGESGRRIDSPKDPALWIAMDGDGRSLYIPEAGKTYRNRILQTPFGGGASVEACTACMFPWDASPSGRYLLTMGEGAVNTMGLAKLPAQRETPYLVHPEWSLYRGRFSPGEEWILFYARTAPDRSRIMAARFDPDRPPPKEEWISLSGDESFHGPAGWSAAEDRVYYASYRDGYRCIWTQAVDPASKQPRGDARAVVHFHDAGRSLKNVPRGMFGFSVSGNTIAYEMGELSGKIHSTRIR